MHFTSFLLYLTLICHFASAFPQRIVPGLPDSLSKGTSAAAQAQQNAQSLYHEPGFNVPNTPYKVDISTTMPKTLLAPVPLLRLLEDLANLLEFHGTEELTAAEQAVQSGIAVEIAGRALPGHPFSYIEAGYVMDAIRAYVSNHRENSAVGKFIVRLPDAGPRGTSLIVGEGRLAIGGLGESHPVLHGPTSGVEVAAMG